MYHLIKPSRGISYVLLLLLLLPQVSQAEEWISQGEEKFELGIGVFLPSFSSSVRVDNTDLDLGTNLDLENDLGLDSQKSTFWASGMWRFSENHRVALVYFNFSRDSVATAQTDIQIGEEVFPAGATLTTSFDFESIPIVYSYSFIKSRKHELAGSFGIHIDSLKLRVKGDAFVGGGGTVDGEVNAKAQFPLPLFGLNYEHHVNKRWTNGIHAEVFSLDLEDGNEFGFSGTIFNVRASTEYWFYNKIGVGFAVNWFSMDVDVKDSGWRGSIDYEYLGPQVYANMRF